MVDLSFFQEKNATQRTKYVAEQKLCFACLDNARKNKAGTNKSKENTSTPTHAAVSDVHDIESSTGLLPIATIGKSSDVTSLVTFVLCDSASTHSLVSSSLVNNLGLVGGPLISQLTVSIQLLLLRLRGSSLQFPPSRIIVISYSFCVHMSKTIFGLVSN